MKTFMYTYVMTSPHKPGITTGSHLFNAEDMEKAGTEASRRTGVAYPAVEGWSGKVVITEVPTEKMEKLIRGECT